MFISHKSNVIQQVNEIEWQCRRKTKGLDKDDYWLWLESITDADGKVDYSGEDYTIIEIIDEDVYGRLDQLSDYVSIDEVYNIKVYASKRDSEIEGVQSHFIGDDSAKDARLLADQWKMIRRERDYRIAETDWMMLSDTGTVSTAWKNYRKALRDIPSSQDSAKVFSDIDWPDKPSS